jgi:hypothetical protein
MSAGTANRKRDRDHGGVIFLRRVVELHPSLADRISHPVEAPASPIF